MHEVVVTLVFFPRHSLLFVWLISFFPVKSSTLWTSVCPSVRASVGLSVVTAPLELWPRSSFFPEWDFCRFLLLFAFIRVCDFAYLDKHLTKLQSVTTPNVEK